MQYCCNAVAVKVYFFRDLAMISTISLHFNKRAMRNKEHNYINKVAGKDYVLESVDPALEGLDSSFTGQLFYMTSQGEIIEPNDYISIKQNYQVTRYQVQKIDYYSEPSEMWIALLRKCPFG
jgi:hypothetical protein